MRIIKLIAPVSLIAGIALVAPQVRAQTMGEYAPTVGVASGGGSSMGTSVASTVGSGDLGGGGGSPTWAVSSVGSGFEERAGAMTGSSTGTDFKARATAGSGADGESRWPGSSFTSDASSSRFNDSAPRFQDLSQERFPVRTELSTSSGERFPASAFDDNRAGLDTNYNRDELDNSHSSGGIDNSYNPH